MKYPAIYETQDGDKLLYINPLKFYDMQSDAWHDSGQHDAVDHEDSDKNITREYLEGKCVKVISPEHSEFVQKLASNAGFVFNGDLPVVLNLNAGDYLFFSGGVIGARSSHEGLPQITIPLPPKAEPEPKEWPQVGGEVVASHASGQILQGELLAVTNEYAIIQQVGHEQHLYLSSWELSKPKTEAEILRDELMEMAVTAMSNKDFDLDHNCYYLISGLMKRYNITKKPQ